MGDSASIQPMGPLPGDAGLLATSLASCVLRDGVIVEASESFMAIAPNSLGRRLEEVLRLQGGEASGSRRYGSYGIDDTQVPVIVDLLARHDGDRLAIVHDGKPFREAEVARFRLTPYAVVRMGRGGRVAFANALARDLLGLSASARPHLADLFSAPGTSTVRRAIAEAECGEPTEPVAAALLGPGARPLRLSLSTDLGPGDAVLGTIAVIRSLELEGARERIKRAALRPTAWRARLGQMLEVIRELVPHDLATFGVYGDGVSLFRAALVEPASARPWPSRWMKMQDGLGEWLRSEDTSVPDLQAYIRRFPGLGDDPVVAQHVADGIRSFVTLPVCGPDGPSSSLSLASRSPDAFDVGSRRLLQELDIAPFLLQFERELAAEQDDVVRAIGRAIRSAASLPDAAAAFVDGLRGHFDWDHASLHRIERRHPGFRVVAQAPDDGPGQPLDRVQSHGVGLLGRVLETNHALDPSARVPEVLNDILPGESSRYPELPAGTRSAIGYPITVAGEWFWILVVCSGTAHAFHGPDTEALNHLVPALEAELTRAYSRGLSAILLEKSVDGVVVTNAEGVITTANRTATERLLGHFGPDGPVNRRLAGYAADDEARDVLEGRAPDTSRRIVLVGQDGSRHPVLATREGLGEGFDGSVWYLVDLDNRDWNVEYRYLREIVSDVAQQTRGPLMLAAATLQRASEMAAVATAGPVRRVVDKVVSEIGKADITFERLADELNALKQPVREVRTFDLAKVLSRVVDVLPERDKAHIDTDLPSEPCPVAGDVARLTFALRSVLGHLLRVRPVLDESPTRILVSVRPNDDRAVVRMSVTGLTLVPETPQIPLDPVLTEVRAARDESGLASGAVERILEAHGGHLTRRRLVSSLAAEVPVWAGFELAIPLAGDGRSLPSRNGPSRDTTP